MAGSPYAPTPGEGCGGHTAPATPFLGIILALPKIPKILGGASYKFSYMFTYKFT